MVAFQKNEKHDKVYLLKEVGFSFIIRSHIINIFKIPCKKVSLSILLQL